MESIETSDKKANANGAWPHLTQHKAADDIANALIQTWADLEVWIFMNTTHNGEKQ